MDVLILTLASGLAGFIDAIVGGGGLILLPALFSTYPLANAATLMGTNKSASVWGSAMATWQYGRRVQLRWRIALPAVVACLLGSALGAVLLLWIPTTGLRLALPWVLVALLIYTLVNKHLGQQYQPRFAGRLELVVACAIGFVIGFYDGFFGPGAGSFFVFALVRILGYDFLSASAHAKLFNMATNLAALIILASQGHVWWHLTVYLLLANVLGSVLGTRLALRRGSGFVRWVFVVVVGVLIVKTSWDAWQLLARMNF